MRNPVCQHCHTHLSEQVHHIDSFMNYAGWQRVAKAYDSDNLMALCADCHREMHGGVKS